MVPRLHEHVAALGDGHEAARENEDAEQQKPRRPTD
jgi:hypothetical protein